MKNNELEIASIKTTTSLTRYCLVGLALSFMVAFVEYAIDRPNNGLPLDSAASINDIHIKTVDYLTAVTMIKEDKRNQLTAADYQLVIDRLMEEELLFQHGLRHGIIYQSDISKKIIDNMLANILSSITSNQKSAKEVEDFYNLQISTNPEFKHAMKDQLFSDIQPDLTLAMVKLEKNTAIRTYVKMLKNKSSIKLNPDSPLYSKVINLREGI